jgi:hypothetical protein
VCSTIQRLDKTTNPLARSERLTISTFRCGRTLNFYAPTLHGVVLNFFPRGAYHCREGGRPRGDPATTTPWTCLPVGGEEIIDELFANIGMRRLGDQHHGIGHEETAEPVCALIWINKVDWLMLAHSAHDVVAIDQAKGKFAGCY